MLKTRHHFFWITIILILSLTLVCGCTYSDERPFKDYDDSTVLQSSEIQVLGGKPHKKQVALTFDDGPHPQRTRQIVDELAQYGFHATFFVVGNRVDGTQMNCQETLAYTLEQGNEIGIHGYTHTVYYNTCTNTEYFSEIDKTVAAVQDVASDYQILHMRPVGGYITNSRIAESPYSIIKWNVDSEDWKNTYRKGDSDEVCAQKINAIVENVMTNVSDGSIILMHDIYESTYDAVKIILKRLYDEGYEVVTVTELLGEKRQTGVEYYKKPE